MADRVAASYDSVAARQAAAAVGVTGPVAAAAAAVGDDASIMRAFNNFAKSVCIRGAQGEAGDTASETIVDPNAPRNPGGKFPLLAVLDLASGRGGDQNKFFSAHMSRVGTYIAADISAVSVEEAKNRWEKRKSFAPPPTTTAGAMPEPYARLLVADVFGDEFWNVMLPAEVQRAIEAGAQPLSAVAARANANSTTSEDSPAVLNALPIFDIISIQFAMHYGCNSSSHMAAFLARVAAWLRPGGVFVGTVVDGDVLSDIILRHKGAGVFTTATTSTTAGEEAEASEAGSEATSAQIEGKYNGEMRLRWKQQDEEEALRSAKGKGGEVMLPTGFSYHFQFDELVDAPEYAINVAEMDAVLQRYGLVPETGVTKNLYNGYWNAFAASHVYTKSFPGVVPTAQQKEFMGFYRSFAWVKK